jgi:hypothetical protein
MDKKTFISYFKKHEHEHKCTLVKKTNGETERRKYVDYLGFEFDGKKILFRKKTIQGLKHKHEKGFKRRELNRKTPKNKPRKNTSNKSVVPSKSSRRLNYLFRSSQIINQTNINKQTAKVLKLKTVLTDTANRFKRSVSIRTDLN